MRIEHVVQLLVAVDVVVEDPPDVVSALASDVEPHAGERSRQGIAHLGLDDGDVGDVADGQHCVVGLAGMPGDLLRDVEGQEHHRKVRLCQETPAIARTKKYSGERPWPTYVIFVSPPRVTVPLDGSS